MKKTIIKKIKYLIISILCTTLIALILIIAINQKLKFNIIELANFEVNKLESTLANNAISEIVDKNTDTYNLFDTTISKNGEIQTVDFNSAKVNYLLNSITIKVQKDLRQLENGNIEDLGLKRKMFNNVNNLYKEKGILTQIPVLAFLNNSILSNLGPKIPIKLHYLGEVNSKITTRIVEYGINNAMVEVYVNIQITAEIILPFITEKIISENNIPIAMKIIQGKIPNYYGSDLVKNSYLYTKAFD